MLFGGAAGRFNDHQVLRNTSDFNTNQQHYIIGNDRILFDGIYDSVGPPFITPFTRHAGHVLTGTERRFNRVLSSSRIIIENVFCRCKSLWDMIGGVYTFSKESLDVTARVAFILTNIHIKYQSPMRRH